MGTYFRHIWHVSRALLKGLGLTFRYMFEPKVTLRYPEQKPVVSDRFRGMLTFHIEECIACDLCVRACPSACISLASERNAAGKKIIQNYTIDFGKCNWCKLCEEACPTAPKSVHHTKEMEVVFMSRDDFKITWLKDAEGRPLTPVNAAGTPINPWADWPERHAVIAAKPTVSGAAPSSGTPATS